MDSLFSLSNRLMISVILVGILTTPTLAVDPLSDEVLDAIGAGGEMVGAQPPEGQLRVLQDADLDVVMASSAFSTFVWPFQYAPAQIPHLLRTVQASDGKGGSYPIGIYSGMGYDAKPNTTSLNR